MSTTQSILQKYHDVMLCEWPIKEVIPLIYDNHDSSSFHSPWDLPSQWCHISKNVILRKVLAWSRIKCNQTKSPLNFYLFQIRKGNISIKQFKEKEIVMIGKLTSVLICQWSNKGKIPNIDLKNCLTIQSFGST